MPYQLIDGKNLSTQILNEIAINVGELKKQSEIIKVTSVKLFQLFFGHKYGNLGYMLDMITY